MKICQTILFLPFILFVYCSQSTSGLNNPQQSLQNDLKRTWRIDGVDKGGSFVFHAYNDYLTFTDSTCIIYQKYDSCYIKYESKYHLKSDTLIFDDTSSYLKFNTVRCGWFVPVVDYETYGSDKFVFDIYFPGYHYSLFCLPANQNLPYSDWPQFKCNNLAGNFWTNAASSSRRLQ